MIALKQLLTEIEERVGKELCRPHTALLKLQSEVGNLSENFRAWETGTGHSVEYHLANMEHACAEIILAAAEFSVRQEMDLEGAVEHLWQKKKMKLWAEKPDGPAPKVENQ